MSHLIFTKLHRHALSLDERRVNFVPSLWDHLATDVKTQDVREVWFKGQHCDIGGGADEPEVKKNEEKEKQIFPPSSSRLSNIPLRWMVRQCIEADTIVVYDHLTMVKYHGTKQMVLESNKRREEMIREEELQRRQLAKVNLIAQDSESTLAEKKIQKDREREKDYAAEKMTAWRDAVRERRRGALFESAMLDKRDSEHKPFDAMKKHRSWHLLEYWPLQRRIQTDLGVETTYWLAHSPILNYFADRNTYHHRPHNHQPRMIHYMERANPPKEDKLLQSLSKIHIDSSEHPVRIHASVVDHLSSLRDPKTYVPGAIWHGLPKDSFPYVEDAVPADKLPRHNPPKGEQKGKSIGAWSEQAEKGTNKFQPPTPGFLRRAISSVWG